MIGRRVRDLVIGDLGTVVEVGGYVTKYRINWDEPTPNRDKAWARVPSRFFDWADHERKAQDDE